MKDQVLCLGVNESFCKDVYEQIKCFKSAGFEGFFTGWNRQLDVSGIKKLADEIGMFYQSIHAPFSLAADMWKGGEAALAAENELISCLRSCAENNVEIMVAHAFIGFEEHTPTPEGIESFSHVVVEGQGVCAKLLSENKMVLFHEEQMKEFLKYIGKGEEYGTYFKD